jgi:hypothetical protein
MPAPLPANTSRAHLAGKRIAVSVSDSPDLARLGLLPREVDRALTAITTALVYAGATIAYGGDLRPGNYTRLMMTDAIRAYRTAEMKSFAPIVHHYVAASTWSTWSCEELTRHVRSFNHMATVHIVCANGLSHELNGGDDAIVLLRAGSSEREEIREDNVHELEALWHTNDASISPAFALTLMREAMASDCHARIVLGGRVSGYAGDRPGVGEEVLITLGMGKPVIALGGFGGCARDIAVALGFLDDEDRLPPIDPAVTYCPTIHAVADEAKTELGRRALAMLPRDLARTAAREDTPETLAILCTQLLKEALAPVDRTERAP